ncbi:NAD(P)-dependent oxidoreductase [uncultured Microscilla sp.]|uniref:NAD(P)-dependent oxidoreductase n=1 Tax=uncultured Microscilla sp. TaxID=432653 RepID=UPI0026063995|nr:NAD(P)-dependent oxidoreductase [uncultured Microscilla sp.]
MKIGIIREGKVPVDKRVPLLPEQCQLLQKKYPQLSFVVQSSPIRCIADEAYHQAGLSVVDDISDCDVILGVKEVPIPQLVEGKTFFFFSHTIKKQAYNQRLLRTILDQRIHLVDYECLTDANGNRIVAFGRFAGVVGAYNGILGYGKRHHLFELRRAHECRDLKDLRTEFDKVKLPAIKIVVTGGGRVGNGITEVLEGMNIERVSPADFLNKTFTYPVFTQLRSKDYYTPAEGNTWNSEEFYQDPTSYQADFLKYAHQAEILISGHYWNPEADVLFTKEDMTKPEFKIEVVADVTCDIEGSIPSTLRATTIDAPFYDYNPTNGREVSAFSSFEHINVMTVDNLPCELPYDASEAFGNQLMEYVFPAFFDGDAQEIIKRASITKDGELTPIYNYLSDYANEETV